MLFECLFDFRYSNRCEEVFYCGFNLHFLNDEWYRASIFCYYLPFIYSVNIISIINVDVTICHPYTVLLECLHTFCILYWAISFSCYWVFRESSIFQVQILFHICLWPKFSPSVWLVFSDQICVFEGAWLQVLQSTETDKTGGRKTTSLHLIGKTEQNIMILKRENQ